MYSVIPGGVLVIAGATVGIICWVRKARLKRVQQAKEELEKYNSALNS